MATTTGKLQESLETEYPLLDTSLLAALISDLPSATDPSHESFQDLHHTLSQLSIEADTQQQQAELDARAPPDAEASSVRLESEDLRGSENSSSSPDDLSLSTSGTTSSSTSGTSATSTTSPLEFLRILFPHLSVTIIRQALRECSVVDDDSLLPVDLPPDEIDMSAVVDHLLTLEYIQDLTERGLEAVSDVESDSDTWLTISGRGNHAVNWPKPKPKQKSRSRTYTTPLVDIRQRQHVLRGIATKAAALTSTSFSEDPWTRLTSLATRLSELLQPTPAGFFMSYFHAPAAPGPGVKVGWKAEGDALRNALSDLVARSATPIDRAELETTVEVLRDIVLNPDSDESLVLDAEQRSRLVSDVRLCGTAARGDSATALDLVWLLRELDDAFNQGNGVAHSLSVAVVDEPSSSVLRSPGRSSASAWVTKPPSPASATRPPAFALPSEPPPIPPPPLSQKHPPHAYPSRKDRGWTVVEPRRTTVGKHAHPHAEFIPAYSNCTGRARHTAKGFGNQFGKGGRGDVRELGPQARNVEWYKARAGEYQLQRTEALREATRHWQGGNAKTRGGEVALYYAEKARGLQEQQKKWALGAARVMVEEKRSTSAEHDILDLHGLTVTEACVIVKEAIEASPPSLAQPLKVITGRGRHSVGHIGVLGPAVRDMLRGEGWHVGKWDGGLVVRGKS